MAAIFQSTHPRGVRRFGSYIFHLTYLFQSTHPRGVRLPYTIKIKPETNLNPRTHVGCDAPIPRTPRAGRYFNPRTHVGCDCAVRLLYCTRSISIHAPTWGATLSSRRMCPLVLFQSTHPRGVRHKNRARGGGDNPISIHAPTWGATRSKKRRLCARLHFNPRTHVGCDFICFSSSFFV